MPFLIAAFETVLGAEALAAAGAALAAEAALTAGAAGAVGATAGAEALGAAGVAAAVPEAAMGINAINPELFASAVNSGAVNPATAFSDIPGLADKLANLPAGEALQGITAADPYLPAGQDLYRPDLVAEVNRFGASPMANQGNMAANPYAQITASNTSGPMAAAPLPAAGAPVPVPVPPAEPPGFLDKLSDTFSPLQKGFEKAQEFAKKNPLIAGPGLTALSRMVSSGSSMPDTTYKGPLSKYKLKNFKGNYPDPRDYQYRRASGGIIDYKEGGTTETPLTHADMGIVVDTDPDTRYLNPVDAARKRAKKLRDRYGISIPEMQAPTPIDEINVGPRTAAHGGIMQVKRFTEGDGVSYGGSDVDAGGEAPGSGTSAGYGTPGADTGAMANANAAANNAMANAAANLAAAESAAPGGVNAPAAETGGGANMPGTGGNVAGTRGTGLFGPGAPFGPANTGPFSPYSGPDRFGGFDGGGGGGYGGDGSGGDTTTPVKPPVTNIDDLKPQFVNPEMYRPTSDPYAHYAKYDNEDYNYLRTPNMAARSSPFNTKAMAEVLATVNKAKGGDINSYAQGGMSSLGGYARGGMPRLLDGPGDGMSDNIPATINDRQPARLADGEFVVPADVVSHLGNGSTKAGSKRLHLMMDQVRQARTGNPKQGKRINPDKFMPR